MKRNGRTSQRTILFRRNVNRNNEEWAHFLEGYREWLMEWDMLEYGDDWHTAPLSMPRSGSSISSKPTLWTGPGTASGRSRPSRAK